MKPHAAYRIMFTERLKIMRKQAGFRNQLSVARELGISVTTYASYESRTLVPHHLIPSLCELLNCSPWLLFTGQPGEFSPPLVDGSKPLHSVPLIERGQTIQ